MPSKLPWDMVKAESLRSICFDITGKRFGAKTQMTDFLRRVEDEGAHEHIVDAAMVGLDTPRAKRKVTSHPTEESHSKDETYLNHRPKRTRRSIGGPATPVKTPRDERAGDRSMKRFEGVVLVSRRRSTRPSQDVGAVVSKEDDGSSEHNEESVGNLKDEDVESMSPILQLQDGKTTSEEDNSIDSARAMVELSTDSTTPGGEQDPDTDIDAEGEIDTTQHGDPNVVSVEVSVAIKNPIDIT